MKLNLRLFTSTDKKRKDNSFPIVISSSSKKKNKLLKREIGISIPKSYWDKRNKCIRSTYQDHEFLNTKLKHILKEYKDAYLKLISTSPDLDDLHAYVVKIREDASNTLDDTLIYAINFWVEKFKNIRSENYVNVVEDTIPHIRQFRPNVKTKEVDVAFWTDFEVFMANKNIANTTTQSIVKRIQTVLKYSRKKGKEVSEEFDEYHIKGSDPAKFSINKDEFLKLYRIEPEKKGHKLAKDIFVFACCNGFRISELRILTKDMIGNNFDYIHLPEEIKTQKERRVPLSEISASIARHYYKNHEEPNLFPYIPESKINKYIKEVSKEAGLTRIVDSVRHSGSKTTRTRRHVWQKISLHIARHTFTTLVLEHTQDPAQTQKIVGHASLDTTMGYSHLTDKTDKVVKDIFKE
jgi:integrase